MRKLHSSNMFLACKMILYLSCHIFAIYILHWLLMHNVLMLSWKYSFDTKFVRWEIVWTILRHDYFQDIMMAIKKTFYAPGCKLVVLISAFHLGLGIKVDMSSEQLVAVPQTIDPAVTVLLLKRNSITSLDGSSFPLFLELLELNLEYCGLKFIYDETFAHQRKLKKLYIRFNFIKHLPLDFGPPVESLRRVQINYAFVKNYDMSPYYFSAFKKLHTIELGGRPVTFGKAHIPVSMTEVNGYHAFATFPDFSNASHLTKLDLCYNKFASLPDEYIYGLVSLTDLYICYGKLKVMPDVSHLKRLVNLRFFSNSISIIPRSSIEGLKFIILFQFYNNKITVMPDISYLRSLRIVEFQNNLITYVPTGVLDGIPYLLKLDLSGNMISYIEYLPPLKVVNFRLGSNQLATLPDIFHLTLSKFYMSNNPLHCNQSLCGLRMWPWYKRLPTIDDPLCTLPQDLSGVKVMKVHPLLLECYNGK